MTVDLSEGEKLMKTSANEAIEFYKNVLSKTYESKEENARAKETAIIKLGEIYSSQKKTK
jgi:26S proteasome regulatory subunit N6